MLLELFSFSFRQRTEIPIFLNMFSIKCLFVLIMVSLVGALQNPHEEAAKFLKRSTPPESTKNAPRISNGGLFLNQKSSSKSIETSMT